MAAIAHGCGITTGN